tara:strand:- start:5889 stop:6695 length:807 start_codon:yes stop_codon:yes gene_type:complete
MDKCSLGLFGWCLILTITLSLGKVAHGIEISPLVTVLSIDGRPNYQQFLIKNNSNLTLPVEIDVNRIQFNSLAEGDSYSVIPDVTSDLLIFPPALVLAPGAVQSVRVQWLGQTSLIESQSYFIRFSQPQLLEGKSNKSGVKIFVHFNAVVHVSAIALKPLLVINHSSITQQVTRVESEFSSQDKQPQYSTLLQFIIDNQGDMYAELNDYSLNITQIDGAEFKIQGEKLVSDQINTFYPPNSKRYVSIHLERPLSAGFSLTIIPLVRKP